MIFIVGNSRSGTTMLGRILGKNENVFTFKELHFFEQLWTIKDDNVLISKNDSVKLLSNLLSIQREGYLNKNRNSDHFINEALTSLNKKTEIKLTKASVFQFFLEYETSKNNKTISCDQTPRNLFYADEILGLFPDAKIINMVRDPRDVLLSQKNKWKRRKLGAKNIPKTEAIRARMNYHPFTISKLWNSNISHILKSKIPEQILTIKFEDLLNNPIEILNEICLFANINFQKEMLLVPQIGSSSGQDTPGSLGINKTRLGQFNSGGLSQEEISICQNVTSKNMKLFDYEKVNVSPNKIKLLFLKISFPFKLGIALLLNLKRMKNIVETIKKRI